MIKYIMSGKDFPKLQTANDRPSANDESAQKKETEKTGVALLMC